MSEETILSETIAASIGGAISSTFLYPLEVIKTKMQAINASDDGNYVDQSATETNASDPVQPAPIQPPLSMIQVTRDLYRQFGITAFVRGIEISALQSSLEKGLYFLSYTFLKKVHRFLFNATASTTNSYVYLLYAYFSGWMHLPITMPVDAWKAQIQSRCLPNGESNISILVHLMRDPSFQFYRGISAYYVLCMTPAIQYWIYEQLKRLLLRKKQIQPSATMNRKHLPQLTFLESFFLGMISRTISTLLVYPYIRRKVLLQTNQQMSADPSPSFKNHSLSIDKHEVIESTNALSPSDTLVYQRTRFLESMKHIYFGIGPELTRGILSASIMLMMKEHISSLILLRK